MCPQADANMLPLILPHLSAPQILVLPHLSAPQQQASVWPACPAWASPQQVLMCVRTGLFLNSSHVPHAPGSWFQTRFNRAPIQPGYCASRKGCTVDGPGALRTPQLSSQTIYSWWGERMGWVSLHFLARPSTVLGLSRCSTNSSWVSDAEGPERHPFPHSPYKRNNWQLKSVSRGERGTGLCLLRPSTLLPGFPRTLLGFSLPRISYTSTYTQNAVFLHNSACNDFILFETPYTPFEIQEIHAD